MKFTYGFTNKVIRGKEYVYFWQYSGTGHKTEEYMGPAGKLKTERRVLLRKIAYLEGLEQEITETIKQAKTELREL